MSSVDEIVAQHDAEMLALQTRGQTDLQSYAKLEKQQVDRTRSRLDGLIGSTQHEYNTLTQALDRLEAEPEEALSDEQLTQAATLQPGLALLPLAQLVARAGSVTDPTTAYAYLRAIDEHVGQPDGGTVEAGPEGHYRHHNAVAGREDALDAMKRLAAVVNGTLDTPDPRPRLRELGRTRRDAIQAINRLNTASAVEQRRNSGRYSLV